jgi:hypothetical protein
MVSPTAAMVTGVAGGVDAALCVRACATAGDGATPRDGDAAGADDAGELAVLAVAEQAATSARAPEPATTLNHLIAVTR